MTLPLRIVVNPTSGGGRARRAVPEFVRALTSAGVRTLVQASTDASDLRRLVREAVIAGEEQVVVCGGDGTLHQAVQELAGTATALGILPIGTGDDNARVLGIPLRDPSAAAQVVACGTRRRVDVAHAVTAEGTDRRFLGVLSTGFDSFVNERANQMSWPKGKARYLVGILAELRTFRPAEYTVTIDGESQHMGAMLIAIGNGVSYGGGMRVCPGAQIDDGLLDVTVLGAVSTGRFLRLFPSVFSGRHVEHEEVSTFRGRAIEVAAAGQIAYADGERIGPLPIAVSVATDQLSVVVPPALSGPRPGEEARRADTA